MFYLTTHSTHFIYGYMASDIWLRTILIVRKETRCRRICYSFRLTVTPTDRIAHTTAFVTPVVEHWLEREIAHWVHSMKDRSDEPSHHERTLLPRSYISLPSRTMPAPTLQDNARAHTAGQCPRPHCRTMPAPTLQDNARAHTAGQCPRPHCQSHQ